MGELLYFLNALGLLTIIQNAVGAIVVILILFIVIKRL